MYIRIRIRTAVSSLVHFAATYAKLQRTLRRSPRHGVLAGDGRRAATVSAAEKRKLGRAVTLGEACLKRRRRPSPTQGTQNDVQTTFESRLSRACE